MLALQARLKIMLNDVILNNRTLKKNILSLTDENKYLYDSLYDMEIQYNNMNQYTRRSNIEINNISEKITQRNLEEYVLKVMKSLDINLVSYDLAYSLINQYSKRLILTNESSKTPLH